jgi:hypothetical protein
MSSRTAAKPGQVQTTIVQSAPVGTPVTANGLIALLAQRNQVENFTANYTGSAYTLVSIEPGPLTGNLSAVYERYGNSARSTTVISSGASGLVKTTVYYLSNGTSYECAANSSENYMCKQVETVFNASDFGVSMFLAALENASTKASITAPNSSYSGIPCTETVAHVDTSYNYSGTMISTDERISGCIQLSYRIPLTLDINSTIVAASSGAGNAQTKPVSEKLLLMMHLVNLTNSSSEAYVEQPPANATLVSG